MTSHPAHQFGSSIAAPGVVVELVGPSASGKSTLARAIAQANPLVRLVASARPAEQGEGGGVRLPPSIERAAKLFRRSAPAPDQDFVSRLLRILPPSGALWRLRYGRYLSELSRRVSQARDAGGVAVFDQGFVTAVGTLAAFGQRTDKDRLLRALQLVPKPDLVIGVVAERQVIARRLATRLAGQPASERLFELSTSTALRQVEIFREMAPLLTASQIRTIWVASDGPGALAQARDRATAEIASLHAELRS